jgi:hypothetical protein
VESRPRWLLVDWHTPPNVGISPLLENEDFLTSAVRGGRTSRSHGAGRLTIPNDEAARRWHRHRDRRVSDLITPIWSTHVIPLSLRPMALKPTADRIQLAGLGPRLEFRGHDADLCRPRRVVAGIVVTKAGHRRIHVDPNALMSKSASARWRRTDRRRSIIAADTPAAALPGGGHTALELRRMP